MRIATDGSAFRDALQALGARGLTRVFCEGGPALAEGLAQADLVDELVLVTGRSARGEGDIPALGTALQRSHGTHAPDR